MFYHRGSIVPTYPDMVEIGGRLYTVPLVPWNGLSAPDVKTLHPI